MEWKGVLLNDLRDEAVEKIAEKMLAKIADSCKEVEPESFGAFVMICLCLFVLLYHPSSVFRCL